MTNTLRQIDKDVTILTELFSACSYGETLTYDKMSEAIGRNVKDRGYIIQQAKNRSHRETHAIFGCITKVGYKRLPPEESPRLGETARASARRKMIRTATQITNAVSSANDLSNDAKIKAYREISTLNTIAHFSENKTVALANPIGDKPISNAEMIRRTLDAFRTVG